MAIETIYDKSNGKKLAIIIYGWRALPGIRFFTDPEDPLQVGIMRRESGHVVRPHTHCPPVRTIEGTSEVLIVREGHLRIDFYGAELDDLSRRCLTAGDIVILFAGGHAIEVMEEAEVIEVKTGPFLDDKKYLDVLSNP